jgi:RecA-superfamily ATPases implicated in signal transduction
MSELVSTGVPGLDSILSGGITKQSTVLVSGNPGTGKSIFGIQYLYTGVTDNDQRGVYVSFEEDEADIRAAAESVGLDRFDELVDAGDIVILDKRQMLRETDFSTAVDKLLDTLKGESSTARARFVSMSNSLRGRTGETDVLLKFSDISRITG